MQSNYKSFQYIEKLSEVEGKEVTLRGWIQNKTGKGKLQFILLRDGTGICQCVVFKDNLSEEIFNEAKSFCNEFIFTQKKSKMI